MKRKVIIIVWKFVNGNAISINNYHVVPIMTNINRFIKIDLLTLDNLKEKIKKYDKDELIILLHKPQFTDGHINTILEVFSKWLIKPCVLTFQGGNKFPFYTDYTGTGLINEIERNINILDELSITKIWNDLENHHCNISNKLLLIQQCLTSSGANACFKDDILVNLKEAFQFIKEHPKHTLIESKIKELAKKINQNFSIIEYRTVHSELIEILDNANDKKNAE